MSNETDTCPKCGCVCPCECEDCDVCASGAKFYTGLDDIKYTTTTTVTETINSMDYNTGWQYSVTGSQE